VTDSEPLVTDLGRSDRIKAANSLWVRNTTLSELAVVSADPGWGADGSTDRVQHLRYQPRTRLRLGTL